MHHNKCEVGFLERYVIFHNQQGCKSFFSTLEIFLSSSFAMQDSFLLNFDFAGFFFQFLDSLPPPPRFTFVMVHP